MAPRGSVRFPLGVNYTIFLLTTLVAFIAFLNGCAPSEFAIARRSWLDVYIVLVSANAAGFAWWRGIIDFATHRRDAWKQHTGSDTVFMVSLLIVCLCFLLQLSEALFERALDRFEVLTLHLTCLLALFAAIVVVVANTLQRPRQIVLNE